VLYTAKCFWPGATERTVERAAEAAARADARSFRGVLYLPGDDLVLGLFDCATRVAAKQASELAGMPCERVIESLWFGGLAEPSTTKGRTQA
jgi:hypothetical protein